MRSMLECRPNINLSLFPVHRPEARFQGAAHQLVQIHGHLECGNEVLTVISVKPQEVNGQINIGERAVAKRTSTVSSSSSHSAASLSSSELLLLSVPFCAPLPFRVPSDLLLCAQSDLSNILHEISTVIIYLQSVSVQASVCGIDGGGSSAGGVHLLRKRHVGKDVFQSLVENGVELFGNLKQ